MVVFKKFVKNSYQDTEINFEFFGFGCGSGDNIPKFAKLARSLGIIPIAVFDNPEPSTNTKKRENDKNVEKTIAECKEINCQYFTHPCNDITDITLNGFQIKEQYQNEIKNIFDKIIN